MATKVFKPYTDTDIGYTLHQNPYYINTAAGGLNPYRKRSEWGAPSNKSYQQSSKWTSSTWYFRNCVLQNCTAYAYGRFMECQGLKTCSLPNMDAGKWWTNTPKYKKGKTPKEGAVLCWGHHVAIVEGYTPLGNGKYKVSWSASNYSTGPYFEIVTADPTSYGGAGAFKGYIYPDTDWSNHVEAFDAKASGTVLPNLTFKTGHYPNKTHANVENNAICVYLDLKGRGWADKPIFAVLGNMHRESTIDPSARYTQGKNNAIGLVQWDPATKWTNWASNHGYKNNDGVGQLEFLVATHSSEWFKKDEYQLTWDEFIHDTTHDVDYLTRAFCKEYERAGVEAMDERIKWAKKWEAYFSEHDFNFGGNTSWLSNSIIGSSGYFTGDFKYEKPNNKHLLLVGGWL